MTEDVASEKEGPSAQYSDREQTIAERLIVEHYSALVRIARSNRRRMGLNDTMCTGDILHETYLKLRRHEDWASDAHFFGAATLAVRQVIIDHARSRMALKRGGDAVKINIDDAEDLLTEFSETPEELLAIAEVLEKLKTINPRWVRIIDARFFSGLTETETAKFLGLSDRTVRRDWKAARDYIADALAI